MDHVHNFVISKNITFSKLDILIIQGTAIIPLKVAEQKPPAPAMLVANETILFAQEL